MNSVTIRINLPPRDQMQVVIRLYAGYEEWGASYWNGCKFMKG